MSVKMTSFKPYLFTAYYNWFIDNGITPHIMVNTSVAGVQVPQTFVQNNTIVLSIAPAAIADYEINAKGISFKAMFRGVSESIVIPFRAMSQLISVENGGALPIGAALDAFDDSDYDEEIDEEELIGEPEFSSVDEEVSTTNNTEDNKNEGTSPSFEIVKDDE